MGAKPKVGRPVGWRKDGARPHRVMVQLSEDEKGWLLAFAASQGLSESAALRLLIEQRRT